MNEIQLFNFQGYQLRALTIEGEPFFVGNDAANAIGYIDTKSALKAQVKAKYKRGWRITTPSGIQEMTVISEPGLYQLASESKLPSAGPFQDWVYEEVLPTIRKHGAYMTPETIEKAILNPDFIIGLATQLKDEQAKTAALTADNETMKPKAAYYDMILANSGLVPITSIAKNYGMSGQAFNSLLHDLGIQFKQSGCWYLYAKYQDKGYVHIEPVAFKHSDGREDVKPQMKWKQHGHKFLYDFLKKRGILPMIERQEMEVSK
jgi:prophage antirepressor-like protein